MIYVLFFFIFIFFMNRAMLKVRVNTENEDFKRKINAKIQQNRKLDLLYGRNSLNKREEIERAILGVAKDINKNREID